MVMSIDGENELMTDEQRVALDELLGQFPTGTVYEFFYGTTTQLVVLMEDVDDPPRQRFETNSLQEMCDDRQAELVEYISGNEGGTYYRVGRDLYFVDDCNDNSTVMRNYYPAEFEWIDGKWIAIHWFRDDSRVRR
jgi:hypothetical protein